MRAGSAHQWRDPEGPPRAFPTLLWGGSIFLIVSVGIVAGTILAQSWKRHRQEMQTRAENHARLVEQNIASSITNLELALDTSASEYSRLRAQPHLDGEAFQRFLLRMRDRLPGLDGIRASDASGVLRFGNGLSPQKPTSIADRDYFIRLSGDPHAGLVLSKPVVGRISGKWVIIFARRLEGPRGEFEGVVYATVLLEQFIQVFSSLAVGPHGVIVLRDPGDTIIARYPLSPELGAISGRRPPPQEFQDLVRNHQTEVTYTTHGSVDQVERTFAVRKIGTHPLYILVGLSIQDDRNAWQHEALRLGLFLLPFTFATLGGAALLHRTWARQQEALTSLSRHELRFRLLFESVGDAIYIQDLNGRILEVNQAACERLGFTKASLVVSDARIPADFAARLRIPEISDLMKDQDEMIFETTQGGREGNLLHVEISCRKIEYEGRTAILSVARDITERRRVDRLKEEFISLVSHELRTPLTSIRGSLGLVIGGVGGGLPDQTRSLLEIAAKNTDQLIRIVNDLLDLQRMERGMMPVALEPLHLEQLIRESLQAQDAYGKIYDVTYTMELPSGPVRVNADAARLQQVMANLLSNATKHSPAGSAVQVRALLRPGTVRVEVRDKGPGIPESFRSHIFHKFAQSQTGNTRQSTGTGLGLSIAKAIVELHGGQIGFSCPSGGGTVFWFELPLLPDD